MVVAQCNQKTGSLIFIVEGLTMETEDGEYCRPGVKTKLFGFVIMALGVLDCLLNLRGGLPAYEKFLAVIFIGACVFAIGAVRGARRSPAGQAQQAQAGHSGAQ